MHIGQPFGALGDPNDIACAMNYVGAALYGGEGGYIILEFVCGGYIMSALVCS